MDGNCTVQCRLLKTTPIHIYIQHTKNSEDLLLPLKYLKRQNRHQIYTAHYTHTHTHTHIYKHHQREIYVVCAEWAEILYQEKRVTVRWK